MTTPVAGRQSMPRRILIVGKSGSGKSTLARKLSKLLAIRHVELDAVFWKPNWVLSSADSVRDRLSRTLDPAGEWIVDGNYLALSDITWKRAELIIWLDYNIMFVLWRLLLRSLWRMWTREKVCGENYENGWAIFGPTYHSNVLLACLRQRSKIRREFPRMIKEYGEDKVVVFRHESDCHAWLEKVRLDHGGGAT